jgi:uncharacterized membrane protein YdfJ with MMPL/SSD domain
MKKIRKKIFSFIVILCMVLSLTSNVMFVSKVRAEETDESNITESYGSTSDSSTESIDKESHQDSTDIISEENITEENNKSTESQDTKDSSSDENKTECYPAHSPHQSTANYLTSFKKLFLF